MRNTTIIETRRGQVLKLRSLSWIAPVLKRNVEERFGPMASDVWTYAAIYVPVSALSKRWKQGYVQKAGRPCPTSVEALENELTCVNATQHMQQPRPVANSWAVSLCNRFVMCTGRFRIVGSWSVSVLARRRNKLLAVIMNIIDTRDAALDANFHTHSIEIRFRAE